MTPPSRTKSHSPTPRLAADPKSPFFARVAAGYLEEGRIREALALCIEGTKIFTRYPTGSLILGKCFEGLGRHAEALAEYRRVLYFFPDSTMVVGLVDRVERLERAAYERFAEGMEISLQHQRGIVTFEEFMTGNPPAQTPSTVEFLIKQLQNAPKPQRGISPSILPVAQEQESAGGENAAEASPTIVTETLAEIYASQGQYREAIQAYKTLAAGKPDETARYHERIAQLEELLTLQGGEDAEP